MATCYPTPLDSCTNPLSLATSYPTPVGSCTNPLSLATSYPTPVGSCPHPQCWCPISYNTIDTTNFPIGSCTNPLSAIIPLSSIIVIPLTHQTSPSASLSVATDCNRLQPIATDREAWCVSKFWSQRFHHFQPFHPASEQERNSVSVVTWSLSAGVATNWK